MELTDDDRKLKRTRSSQLGSVTKRSNTLSDYLDEQTITGNNLRTRIKLLESSVADFQESHKKYVDALLEREGDVYDAEIENINEHFDDTLMAALDLVGKGNQKLEELERNVVKGTTKIDHGKLPDLQLLTFNGKSLQFLDFWSNFKSSVHLNESLEPSVKMRYLLNQLRGAPRDLLQGLPLTNEGYSGAVEMLLAKYGKKERICNAHLDALDHITNPSDSLASITIFQKEIETQIRALEILECPLDDTELSSHREAHRIRRKLPARFQERLTMRKTADSEWSLKELRKAIADEIQRMEDCTSLNEVTTGKNHQTKPPSNSGEYQRKANFSRGRNTDQRRGNHRAAAGNQSIPTLSSTVGSFATTVRSCALCDKDHSAFKCDKYKSYDERKDRVHELELCFRCLTSGHMAGHCEKNMRCNVCKSPRHHALFCFKSKEKADRLNHGDKVTNSVATVAMTTDSPQESVALPTAIVKVTTGNGTVKSLRALFDQGSQRSFLRKGVISKDDAPHSSTFLTIDGFNTVNRGHSYDIVKISVQTEKEDIELQAIVVDSLADRLCMPGIQGVAETLRNEGVQLADSFESNQDSVNVDLLVGADHYFDFVPAVKVRGVNLIPSKLGEMIAGPVNINGSDDRQVTTALHVAVEDRPPERDVDLLWRLDTVGITPEETHPDDAKAMESFNASLVREGDKYVARLPWKASHSRLPVNYHLAKTRLDSQLGKLRKNPTMLSQYHDIIQEQLKNDFVEKVGTVPDTPRDGHYLSHHAVNKESSTTTPIRIVFDCSARTKGGVSLNDCLYSGPSMVQEIPQLLMRFRIGRYAAAADISKAYLMIGLEERDRPFTQFLWPVDPFDPESPLETYRFKVVLFGATCSQFILNATIDHHLKSYDGQDGTSERIRRNIYVDNLFTTADSPAELIQFYHKSKTMLKAAGLHLRSWASNVPEIRSEAAELEEAETRRIVPMLGLRWDTETDEIAVAPKVLEDGPPTKRIILRGLASQFDPNGFMVPITVKTKWLMKEIWEKKFDWDDELPSELAERWQVLKQEFAKMPEVKIDRNPGISGTVTLHAFVDASTKAYGAVVYAVAGERAFLVMAKGRIAPKKILSVPRLELTAAVMGARLIKYVRDAYEQEFAIDSVHVWSDSQVALGWIQSSNTLETYMQNRREEIKAAVPDAKWHYIPTKENPADLITRGSKLKSLAKNKLWWQGPETIVARRDWEEIPEQTNIQVNIVQAAPAEDSLLVSVAKRCRTYQQLVRRISWLLRAKAKFRRDPPSGDSGRELSLSETNAAENWVIRNTQEQEFPDETRYLRGERVGHCPPLVRQLDLGWKDDRVVVITRLIAADVPESVKYPILLPSKHPVTNLVIQQAHDENHHCGTNFLATSLRQRFWIPRMKQRIKSVIIDCRNCRRLRGEHYRRPPIPPLPKFRVDEVAFPFRTTGLDFAGPLKVKVNGECEKRYISLFTCAVTRAVHLEIAQDLSAEAFLRTLARFAARRSYPRLILSDNGSNYTNAAKTLQSWEEHHTVRNTLNQAKCRWRFIPSRAPWFGGMWESMVGLVKSCLVRTLGQALVTEDELYTILCEVEAHLNDRPLTDSSDSPDDDPPLTPSQLLYGRRLDSVPVAGFDPDEDGDPSAFEVEPLTQRQRRLMRLKEQFQLRFHKEYLPMLRQRANDRRQIDPPKVGDIVQIHDPGPRIAWQLGRISEVHPGIDNQIRSVKVKTSQGILTRPVTRLYPLETKGIEVQETGSLSLEVGPDESSPAVPLENPSEKVVLTINDRDLQSDRKGETLAADEIHSDGCPGLLPAPGLDPRKRVSRQAALEARNRIANQLSD